MRAYDPGVELLLYSDHGPYGFIPCQDPGVVRHPKAMYRISNHAFLSGLTIAIQKGVTHMLYLEEDSRVRGDWWAARLFDEFRTYPGAVMGGTPVVYNPSNDGHAVLKRITEFAADYLKASGTAMTIHGFQPGYYFYPNGSISILDVALMQEFFRPTGFENDICAAARAPAAWDEIIGRSMVRRFGINVFDVFAPSVLSYSGCANAIFSEPERIAMLESGEKIAIHQCKSGYTGL